MHVVRRKPCECEFWIVVNQKPLVVVIFAFKDDLWIHRITLPYSTIIASKPTAPSRDEVRAISASVCIQTGLVWVSVKGSSSTKTGVSGCLWVCRETFICNYCSKLSIMTKGTILLNSRYGWVFVYSAVLAHRLFLFMRSVPQRLYLKNQRVSSGFHSSASPALKASKTQPGV